MTTDEALELTREVAEKVMGGTKAEVKFIGGAGRVWAVFGSSRKVVPNYADNIAAAWLVVEEMKRRGKEAYLSVLPDGGYAAEFDGVEWFADNMPEAICRAALEILEEK
jgi:hypothetical protein